MPIDTDVTRRAERVLAELTLEEKVSLLDGSTFWHTQAVERVDVPALMLTDGPHGLRKQVGSSDHLGLAESVPATCVPPAVALGATWDCDLVRRIGQALGDECRAQEVAVLLGPGVNMKRSPLCGRNFEYFSEDPYLAGELGTAMVEGVQSRGVGTSLKHFAANNQETDRMTVSAEVDERTLREIYLAPFERVVTGAQPWTVMCSYNRLNGTYTSEHPWLLTRVLRDEWGFEGLVVSDWGAVNDRAHAVAAGLDLEMPSSGGHGTARILSAVRSGELAEADVDRAALRVLELVEHARATAGPEDGPRATFDADAHHALAREAAARGAVLLKNEGDVLPLAQDGGAVAVIGELARTPRYQGAGSSLVNPTRLDDPLSALTAALAGRRPVTFAAGYARDCDEPSATLVAQAVAAARDADVAVVFLGLPAGDESEGYDRDHMELPPAQVALLNAVAAVAERVVVVLTHGGVVSVSSWQHHADAILDALLLGQAVGSAVADLLVGAVSPSGKLAETIPLRYEDNPTIGAHPGENGSVRYGEGLLIGYRWYDTRLMDVAYPFGHGLSYTSFEYTGIRAEVRDADRALVDVTVTVENTGARAGREIVQIYVADPAARVFRPAQELKGFTDVTLEPGERRPVTVFLDARSFAYWDTALGRWAVEGGAFEIRVASSSRDVRGTVVIDLPGDAGRRPLRLESTSDDWLDHPVAGERFRTLVAGSKLGDALFDPDHGAMMRAIPVVRLTLFPGSPITQGQLTRLLEEFAQA